VDKSSDGIDAFAPGINYGANIKNLYDVEITLHTIRLYIRVILFTKI